MDRSDPYIGESRACPIAWGAVSTWTRCDERLLPRRANEGYTAEPPARARLVSQAYHRHPCRTAPHAPNASTHSLRMPAEQEHLPSSVRRGGFPASSVPGSRKHEPRGACAVHRSESAVRDLGRELCVSALCRLKDCRVITRMVEPHRVNDAHPHIRQGPHRHRMAFALGPFAPVISQRPRSMGVPGCAK